MILLVGGSPATQARVERAANELKLDLVHCSRSLACRYATSLGSDVVHLALVASSGRTANDAELTRAFRRLAALRQAPIWVLDVEADEAAMTTLTVAGATDVVAPNLPAWMLEHRIRIGLKLGLATLEARRLHRMSAALRREQKARLQADEMRL